MILIERRTPKGKLLGYNTDGPLVAQECTSCHEYLPIVRFCKHAGTTLGYNPKCISCDSAARKEKHLANPQYRKDAAKRDYLKHGAKKRQYQKEYTSKNRDLVLSKKRAYGNRVNKEQWWKDRHLERRKRETKAWREANPEYVREYNKQYKNTNRELCIAISTERENRKRVQETFSVNFRKSTLEIFKKVRALNKEHGPRTFCVDHIIPLKHPDVCGLHYPENFQIISAKDNARKSNKWDGTERNESWKADYE